MRSTNITYQEKGKEKIELVIRFAEKKLKKIKSSRGFPKNTFINKNAVKARRKQK
jgi:hypothetical protein